MKCIQRVRFKLNKIKLLNTKDNELQTGAHAHICFIHRIANAIGKPNWK